MKKSLDLSIPFSIEIHEIPLEDLEGLKLSTDDLKIRVSFFNTEKTVFTLDHGSVEIAGIDNIQYEGEPLDPYKINNTSYVHFNRQKYSIAPKSKKFLGVVFSSIKKQWFIENESTIFIQFTFARLKESYGVEAFLTYLKDASNNYTLIDHYIDRSRQSLKKDEEEDEEEDKIQKKDIEPINSLIKSNLKIFNNKNKILKISSLKCTAFINDYKSLEYKIFVDTHRNKPLEKKYFIKIVALNKEKNTIAERIQTVSIWNEIESHEIVIRPESGLGVVNTIEAHLYSVDD